MLEFVLMGKVRRKYLLWGRICDEGRWSAVYSVKWGFQWLTRVSIGFAPTAMLWMIYLLKALESMPSKLLCYSRSKAYRNHRPHTLLSIFGCRHPLGVMVPCWARGDGRWLCMPLRGSLLTRFGGGALLITSDVNGIAADFNLPIDSRKQAW